MNLIDPIESNGTNNTKNKTNSPKQTSSLYCQFGNNRNTYYGTGINKNTLINIYENRTNYKLPLTPIEDVFDQSTLISSEKQKFRPVSRVKSIKKKLGVNELNNNSTVIETNNTESNDNPFFDKNTNNNDKKCQYNKSNLKNKSPLRTPTQSPKDSALLQQLCMSPELKPKTIIGDYQILGDLGQGTFGQVKLAKHLPSKRKVAIKVIYKSTIKNQKSQKRVEKELRLFPLLRHPNIVKVFDIIEDETKFMIVLEYLENGELFKFVINRKRLSEKQARYFFRQIVSALNYCHQNFIIHRDLKPENMLLDSDMQLRLIDFGFANFFFPDQTQSTFCGSPYYASPEMVKGVEYIGPEVDIWSLGVTLYSLISGKLPFNAYNTKDFLRKICKGDFEIPPYFSNEVANLIKKMLQPDKNKRITLEKIRCHKWTNIGYSDLPTSYLNIRPLTVKVPNEKHLSILNKYGFSSEETRSRLMQSQVYHPSVSLYHLLNEAKKKKRQNTFKRTLSNSKKNTCKNKTILTENQINTIIDSSPIFCKEVSEFNNESTSQSRRYSIDTIKESLNDNEENNISSEPSIKEARRSFDSISRRSTIKKTYNNMIIIDQRNSISQPSKNLMQIKQKESNWFSGFFNVSTTTNKPFLHITQEIERVLDLYNVGFLINEEKNMYTCNLSKSKLTFEILIYYKESIKEHVLQFRNVKGSSWAHKKLSYKLVQRMFI